ncbi:unnamed protein product, partial [Ectocarpus sp. 4 AP-2014]
VRRAHGPRWRGLLNEQEASRRLFEKNERTLRGRVANTFRAVDWRGMVGAERRRGGPRDALGEAFDVAKDEGKRRRGLRRKQEREKSRITAAQRALEKREQKRLAGRQQRVARLGREAYLRVARALDRRRGEAVAAEREQQRRLTRERNEALRASRQRTRRAKRREERSKVKLSRKERTDPLHLTGNEAAQSPEAAGEAARQMDEAKAVIKKKRTRRERKPR